MENQNLDIHSVDNANKVEIINKEIDCSIQTIHQGKKILVNFITLYITAVFGFFYYGAYIQGKISLANVNPIPPNELIILGVVGVLLVLIIFLFGWALLGLVTSSIFATIKQYKNIKYLRGLSATLFPNDEFRKYCLNPVAGLDPENDNELPISIPVSLPYIFSLVNFFFLLSSLFFLQLFLPAIDSITFLLFPLGFFAIFYTNLYANHFTELKIVKEITPLNNESTVRKKYAQIKNDQKKIRWYRISFIFLVVLSCLYFLSFFASYYFRDNAALKQNIVIAQSISVLFLGGLSYLVTMIKVNTRIISISSPFSD